MVYGHPNGVNCVKGEIHNVLSVMRVNARWASTSRFKREIPTHTQSPLLRRFKELHVQLEGVMDLGDVDTLNVLEPFVHVIESEKTSGIITGAAVSSLNKFLLYGLIPPDGLRATEAINRIALCVSRCRFEETHRDVDEMVLMKLMELLECCVRCEAGRLISGDNIWKMVHTCYSISCQPRASMHLCHTAENTLAHVILTVFDRIADMDPIVLGADEDDNEREDNESEVVVPYGIPVLEQLLTFLSDLIKPKEKEDTTVLGLSLINLVLETAGTGLGAHPCLVHVLQGNLSKYLLQNSETTELHVLSLTLRVVFNLFNSIKDHLKVQLEVFLQASTCASSTELALESLLEFCREPALMLDLYINYDCDVHCTNLFEVLCKALARNTQVTAFAPDVPPVFNILNLLALEGLLAVLESIARRCPLGGASSMADVTGYGLAQILDGPIPSSSSLPVRRVGKQSKKRYSLAADKFHNEPKNWVAYAQQLGLLPNPVTAESVAAFFHTTPGLDKTKVGEYLGEGPEDKYPFHAQVRDAYVGASRMRVATTLDQALRLCLSKFRLPGEAQKIDRMMETFSREYYRQIQLDNLDQPLADADAAFILSFSIIMLNTDLHSDQIQRKMTVDEFVRNNRGINAGQDLPREYLVALYNNLQANQIKMQTDVSDLNTDDAIATVDRYSAQWEGVLKRQQNVVGASFTSNASVLKLRAGRHEREMFRLILDTTTSSILTAFERTGDESTMAKALDGIASATKIAIYFQLVPEVNKLIAALAAYFVEFAHGVMNGERVLSMLLERHMSHRTLRRCTCQRWTLRASGPRRLGQGRQRPCDFTRRRATSRTLRTLQLLFDVVAKYADCLRQDAWTSVVECILIFNELDIAPTSLVEMDDFVDSRGVPLPPAQAHLSPRAQQSLVAGVSGKTRERSRRLAERQAAHRQQRNLQQGALNVVASGGFWDSLSSYLWSEDDDDVDLNYPLELEAPSLQVLSERLAAGLHMLVKGQRHVHARHASLDVGDLVQVSSSGSSRSTPNGWPATLDALKQLVADGIVGLWTGVCMRLVNQRTGLEVDALQLLYAVANSDAADGCWIDLMRILLSYLQDERAAVARAAWDCLYRSLMLPGHPIAPLVWKDCFEEIIYTLDDRSRSNGPAKDSKDLSLYSTTLLSKVFLYNIHTLAGLDCFHTLWLNVLRRLATKLALPPNAATSVAALEVYETTLHALHNLLVVMTAEGIFERTSAQSQQDVLTLSYDLIRSVCPQVLDQLRFDSTPSSDAMMDQNQPPGESAQVESPIAIEIFVETETKNDTRAEC
ncbi:hypothetical protein SPRG_21512 [Saprolegnia parasitica CBS 223.65]|uniref:SEC7 domain-containing protein n=1 Tax=Saprolegnia parasitica (strain CBS 223.65) TaxID=695850 RepID=A0A067BRW9_SAPPC|nr:hypothetical protein SPRG_21512 [Saprolegnia parasitica CBS 223.65]KDO19550.1 hypothetical protein SPRG_21512 [Saprolegnia parasitica CBS 223.65]|eukprot:XP_012209749.1 hypothetical protein SPRG_21512 [Saprolegnia parasitica CBS 223.65]